MSWLLDTVALSETFKLRPNPGFVSWLGRIAPGDIHTSVLCLGEIRRGVERLSDLDRRARIAQWLEADLAAWLSGRILPVSDEVAQTWGRLSADRSRPPVDTLIGATALVSSLTVVTRNTRDFDGLGVPVLNPWT